MKKIDIIKHVTENIRVVSVIDNKGQHTTVMIGDKGLVEFLQENIKEKK